MANTSHNQQNDVSSVISALGVKAFKLIGSFAKLGYGLILNGIFSFVEWRIQMRNYTESILSKGGFSDSNIDELIEMVWDSRFKHNGESHTMREWAVKYQQETRTKQHNINLQKT